MAGYDTTNPTDNSIVSQFPANERAMRAAISSAHGLEHDAAGAGRHKFTRGNTSARDAITTWVDGSLYVNTSASSANPIIEIYTSAASSWGQAGRFTSADEVKLDGIATAAEVNAVQVSADEISAGTLTSVRSFSPADIVAFVSAHTSVTTIFTSRSSSQAAIAASSVNEAVHSLGGAPQFFTVSIRCVTSSNGYAVGDEIMYNSLPSGGVLSHSIYANASVVGCVVPSSISLPNKTTKVDGALTLSNFNFVFRAWI